MTFRFYYSQVGQAQLLWGFHLKIMGVQKLHGLLENLWGVLPFGGGLVGEWKLSWGIFPWGLLEGPDVTNIESTLSLH